MNQNLIQKVYANGLVQGLFQQGIVGLLALVVLVWSPFAAAASLDKSDLKKDYTVDILDLQKFATDYLGVDWETYNWCQFYETSLNNEKYFRDATSEKTSSFESLLQFIADSYNCQVVLQVIDKSDLNNDLVIDSSDLRIFSTNYLETYWETVDW